MTFIDVQYNPSSLSISATANEVEVEEEVRPGLGSAKKQKKQPASITLRVQLIFDSDGALENKVRTKIEGLMGMISDTTNYGVVFLWGDMSFRGMVTSMTSSYTMFDILGKPVRGTVNMTISQKLENSEKDYWDNAFSNSFK